MQREKEVGNEARGKDGEQEFWRHGIENDLRSAGRGNLIRKFSVFSSDA